MITIRKASERGEFRYGGLVSYHSFSFGEYYDEKHMNFRALRVINDDTLAGGFGFPTHPHRDMEIVTYVTQGTIEHKDSMGNVASIRTGEFQRMTAGSGVKHSEYNASKSEVAKLLQIWIIPEKNGLTPGYEQRMIETNAEGLTLAASPGAVNGSLHLNQDVNIYVGRLPAGKQTSLPLPSSRFAWIQLIDGELDLDTPSGQTNLQPGDGATISEIQNLLLSTKSSAHFLAFDLG